MRYDLPLPFTDDMQLSHFQVIKISKYSFSAL